MEHGHNQGSTDSPMARDSRGDFVPGRPERPVDGTADQGNDASAEEGRELQRGTDTRGEPSQLPDERVLVAQVKAILQEIHYHPPLSMPDEGKAASMRRNTPELYQAYVKSLNKAVDAEYIERTSPFTQPSKDVRIGQICGVIVVIAVLAFAAYALYLDRPWVAGIITALDVVALAAIFANSSTSNSKDT
ncbi:hypothetical protein [Corynebacterium mastitidis]|uniref:hypothetical protein n=1 Tax=Corynebacterium mastitidis TaxID=161890 RepID=UPI0012EA3B91|nr:hypothetical protein [Corynebacterium mastitidis]